MPKIPSYRIIDVAEAIGPECEHEIVGIRPGEKIHEEMITASDSFNTVDLGHYYAILPSVGDHALGGLPARERGATRVQPGFCVQQRQRTPNFLTVEQLRALIRSHVSATPSVGGKPHDPLRPPEHQRGRHRGRRRGAAVGLPDARAGGPALRAGGRRSTAASRTPSR